MNAPGPDRAVVFQNHSLLPWLTVYQNVEIAVDKIFRRTRSAAERKDWILHNLAMVNMSHALDRLPSQISGGMKQRVGIAQALLGRPRLVIVDEPTAGLDPEERNRFHNLLSEVSENIVVILSTHIVEDVRQLCPRMAILAGGEVVRSGAPATLVAELEGRVWRRTVDKGAVDGYRKRFRVISTQLFEGRTRLHVLHDGGPPEPGFAPVEPGLEDVYFSILQAPLATAEASHAA